MAESSANIAGFVSSIAYDVFSTLMIGVLGAFVILLIVENVRLCWPLSHYCILPVFISERR